MLSEMNMVKVHLSTSQKWNSKHKYKGRPSKNQNYLLEGGPLVVQAFCAR